MPPRHPNQVGRIESESFSFLNELARAFRSGESNPRPSHFPVLEGIRGVLAELQSASRLIPAGGMALTAEQVEDVRTLVGHGGSDYAEAFNRLRALSPATEPAEKRCQKWTVRVAGGIETGIQCVLPAGHECFHDYVPAAPAEPTEEETKAEAWTEKVADLESQLEAEIANRDAWEQRLTNLIYSLATVGEVGEWTSSDDLDEKFIDHIGGKIQQLEHAALAARGEGWYEGYKVGLEYGPIAASGEEYDGPINPYDVPSSSPVVPAPTETEWQTWQEVPDGVKYSPKARPPTGSPLRLLAQPLWVNRGETRYQARSGTVSKIGDVEMFHYAPFVAAEEG